MRVIDGNGAVLGRLASFVAKQLLEGEEVVIVNCENIIVTGNQKTTKAEFKEKREKVGTGQKGPKIPRLSERIVKRAVRGMLPNHRKGKGKIALRNLKCYSGAPKEFEAQKKISAGRKLNVPHKGKILKVGGIFK